MADETIRVRSDKFGREWRYAMLCFDLMRRDLPLPPVPSYTIWTMDEDGTNVRIKATPQIMPQPVSYGRRFAFKEDDHGA